MTFILEEKNSWFIVRNVAPRMKMMPKYASIVERVLKQELAYPEDTKERGASAHLEAKDAWKKSASAYPEEAQ
jgi:hypothetical protein